MDGKLYGCFFGALLAVASTKDTHKKKQEELGALKEMNVSGSQFFSDFGALLERLLRRNHCLAAGCGTNDFEFATWNIAKIDFAWVSCVLALKRRSSRMQT